MSLFLTSETIGDAIEKIEGKVWSSFDVGKTLAEETAGTLLTKEGERHRVQEWTPEVRKAKEKVYCAIENIGKALALAVIVAGVAALILLAVGTVAATVVGLSALGLLVILLILGGVANSRQTEFEQQGLLRVQRLWNERRYDVALAKLPKITDQPEKESILQSMLFKEYLSQIPQRTMTMECMASTFAALLLKGDNTPPFLETYIKSNVEFIHQCQEIEQPEDIPEEA